MHTPGPWVNVAKSRAVYADINGIMCCVANCTPINVGTPPEHQGGNCRLIAAAPALLALLQRWRDDTDSGRLALDLGLLDDTEHALAKIKGGKEAAESMAARAKTLDDIRRTDPVRIALLEACNKALSFLHYNVRGETAGEICAKLKAVIDQAKTT